MATRFSTALMTRFQRVARSTLVRLHEGDEKGANDFLAYLEDREESEATAELLAIPGFEKDLEWAIERAENGDTFSLKAIRRGV